VWKRAAYLHEARLVFEIQQHNLRRWSEDWTNHSSKASLKPFLSLCGLLVLKMQISVPLFSSPPNPKIPSLFPSQHLPSIFHGKGKPTTLTTRNFHFLPLKIKNKPFIVKASSFLSEIGRAIEEEEDYRKARAAVIRKGIDLGGYAIEGLSIGGQETCIIIPEFKCAFDIGRCPTRAIHQNFVFITHAHLDHIVGFFSTTHVFGIPCEERKKNMFSSFPNWLRLTLLFSKTCGLCLVFVRIEYGCSVIWWH